MLMYKDKYAACFKNIFIESFAIQQIVYKEWHCGDSRVLHQQGMASEDFFLMKASM